MLGDAHNATIIWSWDSQKNWIQPRQFFLSKKHRIILHSQKRTPYIHSCSVVLGPHCALFQCFYPASYFSGINNEFKTRTISKSSSYYIWLSFVPHERKSVDKFHISREYTSWASTKQEGSIFTADSNPAASLRLPSIADTNTPAGAIAAIPPSYCHSKPPSEQLYAAACVLWFLCTMNWNSGTWILMVIRSAQDGLQRRGSPNLRQPQTKPKK